MVWVVPGGSQRTGFVWGGNPHQLPWRQRSPPWVASCGAADAALCVTTGFLIVVSVWVATEVVAWCLGYH